MRSGNQEYEYDVVVQGEHLNINPKDLASARELARSWGGQIVQRKVDPWEALPESKQDRREFTVRISEPDDDFSVRIVIYEGRASNAPVVESWCTFFSTVNPSLRSAGYSLPEKIGPNTFRVYR